MPLLSPWTRRTCAVFVLTLFVGASLACTASEAEVSRLQEQIEELRAQQAQTAAELAELKSRLGQADGAVRTLTIANRPSRGEANAPVTFIEYSDYGCQYCAQYSRQVYPRLIRDCVERGKIRYVFKNYPVEELHPDAFTAHVAAACAGDQGRYWVMHDRLFADQANFTTERFIEDARGVGLDLTSFQSCLAGTTHDAVIRQDIDEAVRGGVNGTPVFVVALSQPGDAAVTPVRVVVGAQPYEAIADAIEAVLAQASTVGKDE